MLRESVAKAGENGRDVLERWELLRRSAGEEKESTYGSSWSASFSKNDDWATVAGLSAYRMSVSAGQHLFRAGQHR